MKKIYNGLMNKSYINKEVELYGFVDNKRNMGNLIFVDLRDESGIIQLIFRKDNLSTNIKKETVIKVIGNVVERKMINKNISTGQIEVIVNSYEIISEPKKELPFAVSDNLNAKEDTRLKHRFLDLRRSKMKKNLWNRYKLIKGFRNYLDSKKFIEIETPYLSKSTPEGANDFIVQTRTESLFFALPQSPQLYKQSLMASGFEKYFQIARNFRDEDSRSDRQPEFTQLDMEMSFTNQEEIIKLVEEMFQTVFKEFDKDISFSKMDYKDAIDKYGTDKPDLRYENLLIDVTKYVKNSTFSIFANAITTKMIAIDYELTKKDIKILEEIAIKNGAKGLLTVDHRMENSISKKIEKEINKITTNIKDLKWKTLLFVSDNYQITTKSLGAIRVALNKLFNMAKSDDKFVWILNWPLFEKVNNKIVSVHHPFTAPIQGIDLNDVLSTMSQAYDLVWNGYEIGGGSIRINDKNMQNDVFKILKLSNKQIEAFDYFMEIFDYGLPTHGGIAFGIDRIAMLLNNEDTIREVIAFPKNSNGMSPFEKIPSKI